jgi:opacity protein-like surface antigen
MKSSVKKVAITLGMVLVAFGSYAQRGINPQWYTALYYSPSMPLGTTSQYIDRTSLRGVSAEAGHFLGDRMSIGLAGSWNVYYKDAGSSTRNIDNTVTVSGREYRYINAFPLMAKFNYYLGDQDGFSPFVGIGGGALYVNQESQIGGVTLQNKGWQAGIFPEAGLRFALPRISINLGVRYHHGFETGKFAQLSYLSANVGLVWLH